MKKRKINTPLELHLNYMCEFIDDYHDICKFAKELIKLGYNSKALENLSDISKNKELKNFDKNYSEFISDFKLSKITYKNSGIVFLEILSKEYLNHEILLDEYMKIFYYLYYISNTGLQSDNFDLNKSVRELNEIYKEYNLLNINEVASKDFNKKKHVIEDSLNSLLISSFGQ